MIVDVLANRQLYGAMGRGLSAALEYLATRDFGTIAPGRYDVGTEGVHALVQDYTTKPESEGIWEAHRKFWDVQFVARGEERIGFSCKGFMTEGVYDEGRDFLPIQGHGDFATLRAGMFAVLAPDDTHMPGIHAAGPSSVRKVVVKVPVATLR